MRHSWRRTVISGLLAAAGIAAAVYATWRLTRPDIAAKFSSVEEAWDSAILRLGIEPVYPPEEDLVVGDILAVVVADSDPDPNADDKRIDRKATFLKRSVKIAHADVRAALESAYTALPLFSTDATPKPADGAPAPAPEVRHFPQSMPESALPRAAFPSLTIVGLRTAATGVSGGGLGSGYLGASSDSLEELRLHNVTTYGLPSARASEVLRDYCGSNSREDCLEETARVHLERVVGDRINAKYYDETKKGYSYALAVEIVMVSRVYMTKCIIQLNKSGRSITSQLGTGKEAAQGPAASAGAQADAEPCATPEPSARKRGAPKEETAKAEVKAPSSGTGGGMSTQFLFDNESKLQETFERPVTFGYRSVKFYSGQ